ncbi:hypothetical protein GCM10010193_19460 [Kitasatospora atroaurantiaca]|uniref:Excreted virulence factor EspC (Type VII ESX diderm) n=1 Tax=Kitasatospora atroaurantiaca TaxID=285545 RepID=A0A561EPM1_9ACTN|nr:hypothetical protein [Kitasatospora atroaurantiaca]TWE17534.1 hypothetical protein FB465_2566 [Kitasatospora atroaurantiaca]
MSTGTGSSGGSGAGYRVEVDGLRAFASQVRGLLSEFQAAADGTRTHGQSGVGRSAFGTFAEAEALHDKYEAMRDGLRDVLNALQDAIDEAQRKADLTAANYEEQEHETSRHLKVSGDGWSVGNPSATTQAMYSSSATTRPSSPTASPRPPAGSAPAGSGEPQPTW